VPAGDHAHEAAGDDRRLGGATPEAPGDGVGEVDEPLAAAQGVEHRAEDHEHDDVGGADPQGDAEDPLAGHVEEADQPAGRHPRVPQEAREVRPVQRVGQEEGGGDRDAPPDGALERHQQGEDRDRAHHDVVGGHAAHPEQPLGPGEHHVDARRGGGRGQRPIDQARTAPLHERAVDDQERAHDHEGPVQAALGEGREGAVAGRVQEQQRADDHEAARERGPHELVHVSVSCLREARRPRGSSAPRPGAAGWARRPRSRPTRRRRRGASCGSRRRSRTASW